MITVITRAFDTELEVRESERTITGVAVPYGQRVQIGTYWEEFAPGAFDITRMIDTPPPLTATHPRSGNALPIGPRSGNDLPIGVTVGMQNDQVGLIGTWKISKTELGNDVLELIKDRAIKALSIGFIPLPGGDRWSPDSSSVVRVKADLDHVAVVRVGAYPGALISSLRASDLDNIQVRLRLARRRSAR
jgi:HK97 family phage prohead protease